MIDSEYNGPTQYFCPVCHTQHASDEDPHIYKAHLDYAKGSETRVPSHHVAEYHSNPRNYLPPAGRKVR